MNVQPAWQVTEGSGVTVAVIDSGVDPERVRPVRRHGHLRPRLHRAAHLAAATPTGASTARGWRPSSPGTAPTAVTTGSMGIAPEAKVLSIRVIPDKGDPGYQRLQRRAGAADPGRARRRDHDRGQGPCPGDQHVDRLLGAERRGARRDRRTPTSTAPSWSRRRATRATTTRGTATAAPAWRRCRSPPSTRACSAWARSPSTGTQASFSSGNLSVQVAAPGKGVPAQGGTACTTPSTAPARRARSWRASRR